MRLETRFVTTSQNPKPPIEDVSEGEAGFAIFDLLMLACVMSWVASPVVTASRIRAGYGGYSLALVVGLLIGVCSVWSISKLCHIVETKASKSTGLVREMTLGAVYVLAVAWMLLAIPIGRSVTGALLR